jgi:hypothetical protein
LDGAQEILDEFLARRKEQGTTVSLKRPKQAKPTPKERVKTRPTKERNLQCEKMPKTQTAIFGQYPLRQVPIGSSITKQPPDVEKYVAGLAPLPHIIPLSEPGNAEIVCCRKVAGEVEFEVRRDGCLQRLSYGTVKRQLPAQFMDFLETCMGLKP